MCVRPPAEGRRARPGAGRRAAAAEPAKDPGARVCLALTRRPFPPQMMMQYLYHGGAEAMDIPAADVLEVRARRRGEG